MNGVISVAVMGPGHAHCQAGSGTWPVQWRHPPGRTVLPAPNGTCQNPGPQCAPPGPQGHDKHNPTHGVIQRYGRSSTIRLKSLRLPKWRHSKLRQVFYQPFNTSCIAIMASSNGRADLLPTFLQVLHCQYGGD